MANLPTSEQLGESPETPREIEVPAPTAWPFVLAFGCSLLFAGLVTSVSVTWLGAVLALAGSIGWFRDVLPREHEETVPVVTEEIHITTERRVVERVPVPAYQRAWLPVHTYPISAGIKGGLAGGVAMAVLACAYGVLKARSIWYPINLLAAAVYAESLKLRPVQLYSFHADSFAIALGLHAGVSTLVGLLYGAMLPMFPRRPIILGGLIAPALWSALIYTILGLLNPLLASHIDWPWFIASQVGFGIVAGLVVVRHSRMPTRENLSFAIRAGIEAPGMIPPRGEERQ
jgi:membrane associated rhomboid family serine protease